MPKTRENPYHCDNAIEGVLRRGATTCIDIHQNVACVSQTETKIILAMSPKTFLSAQSLLAEMLFSVTGIPNGKFETLYKMAYFAQN